MAGFRAFRHNVALELIWTGIPSIILMLILYPSMVLLYGYDKPYVTDPYVTFKAIAHQ
jgi:heme/copper-type cytochrome/quinol oxidase subunit 2